MDSEAHVERPRRARTEHGTHRAVADAIDLELAVAHRRRRENREGRLLLRQGHGDRDAHPYGTSGRVS